jgi:hypothetical protein
VPTIPLEAAIVAALIGLAGGLIGQFFAVFLGARYAAELSRKTQLEIDTLGFQRHWREQLVRPFLNLVTQRLALISEFNNAVTDSNFERAMELAREFNRTEALIHAATFATFGNQQLSNAGDAWMESEQRLAARFAAIAAKNAIERDDATAIVEGMIDLVDATGMLFFAAGRYTESGLPVAKSS